MEKWQNNEQDFITIHHIKISNLFEIFIAGIENLGLCPSWESFAEMILCLQVSENALRKLILKAKLRSSAASLAFDTQRGGEECLGIHGLFFSSDSLRLLHDSDFMEDDI